MEGMLLPYNLSKECEFIGEIYIGKYNWDQGIVCLGHVHRILLFLTENQQAVPHSFLGFALGLV